MTTWVLLRGLAREAGHWGGFAAQLRAAWPGCEVRAVDLPGAGPWHAEATPPSVEAIARRCRAQLRRDGAVPPYRLVGLSLGGMVAAAWASAWPAEVSHCVLVNTSMRPFGSWLQRLRPRSALALGSLLLRRDPVAIERAVLRLTSSRPGDHGDALEAWVAIRRARPVARANALRQLLAAARYRAPAWPATVRTLVLCSDGDRLVDAACSRRLAQRWACRVAVHPEAGHDLPLDDDAWVVAQMRHAWPG